MCDLDLEHTTVWDETIIKRARKDHECDCCGATIPKGDSYLKHFSVFDGDVTCEKQCNACTAMVEEFTKVHGQHSNPSYMPELLHECMQLERGDDDKMADKWRDELRAMRLRSKKPPVHTEDLDDVDEDEDDEDDEDGEAGEEAKAGDDQGGQAGGN